MRARVLRVLIMGLALPIAGGIGLAVAPWLAVVSAPADPVTPESTTPRPLGGLELLHIAPAGQPPLEFLDPDHFDDLRQAFNADTSRVRIVLMVSPSCPFCLRGTEALEKTFAADSAAALRIFVVWMHVTHGDRQEPNSLVLARVSDRRASQYWDPYRLLSKVMLRDYPPDTALAMADTAGAGPPVIWDLVALWGPGVTWKDRVPMPDFAGHPIVEVLEPFRAKLDQLVRLTARRRAP